MSRGFGGTSIGKNHTPLPNCRGHRCSGGVFACAALAEIDACSQASRAARKAIASPIPRDAPVMKSARPLSDMRSLQWRIGAEHTVGTLDHGALERSRGDSEILCENRAMATRAAASLPFAASRPAARASSARSAPPRASPNSRR
jgi:hypothetical protein